MRRKILLISLVVAVIAVLTVGTFAWFNANDEIKNVFAIGGVEVKQIEQQRNPDTGVLEEFEDYKRVAPVIDNANAKNDPYNNFQDKIVSVKNIGKSDAYVQTYVAIPASLDNAGVIHIYDSDASSNGWVKVSDVDATADGSQPCFPDVLIDGQKYNIYLYRYTDILESGDTTKKLMDGVFIDMRADQSKDEQRKYFTIDGKEITGFDRTGELRVYVCTQAMQAKNFEKLGYEAALIEGFGTGSESLPNFNEVTP